MPLKTDTNTEQGPVRAGTLRGERVLRMSQLGLREKNNEQFVDRMCSYQKYWTSLQHDNGREKRKLTLILGEIPSPPAALITNQFLYRC